MCEKSFAFLAHTAKALALTARCLRLAMSGVSRNNKILVQTKDHLDLVRIEAHKARHSVTRPVARRRHTAEPSN